jgi:hypothetical protein
VLFRKWSDRSEEYQFTETKILAKKVNQNATVSITVAKWTNITLKDNKFTK